MESGRPFRKKPPQYTQVGSNPEPSIINILVYCESDALDHAATKAESSKVQNVSTLNRPPLESFETMLKNRRDEARRSILVQHFVVVEFAKEDDVKTILSASGHVNISQVIPVHSPFLWFRAKEKSRKKGAQLNDEQTMPLMVSSGNTSPTQDELRLSMLSAESLSEQMNILYCSSALDDLGIRLRFLTALQLELALNGLFPLITALPFGSSVSGFGKVGCDLDLVLHLGPEHTEDDKYRLVFHAKTSMGNGRTQVQRHMETIGDMCQMFLPGCTHIKRILQARVPIIKYKQEFTGVECDLSMTNMTAVYMGELLYIMGSLDDRVKPLVFAVRMWAREVGLTNPTPGRWITNFSLILLVIFFLQQRSPVLPSLKQLVAQAGPDDRRITPDGVNCTFIRDLKKLIEHNETKKQNKDSLETLLLNFFEFYSSFDFSSRAISIVEGMTIPKPEHAPLYIVNPLERGFNVSKNVSHEETERLRIELRNAAWALESTWEKHDSASSKSKIEPYDEHIQSNFVWHKENLNKEIHATLYNHN
ncbi:unnamed protein product [Timema podura]|uniref:Poly(A) RNA polymerase, mitochondrial n=1 Tax=Timema podura TaxID=61482 RepID=A0ABN7NU06_TIMPD|nr:unnamed protein product [Timema podura]